MYFYKLIQQKCYVELNKKYARSIAITERKIVELFFVLNIKFKENHLIVYLMWMAFTVTKFIFYWKFVKFSRNSNTLHQTHQTRSN